MSLQIIDTVQETLAQVPELLGRAATYIKKVIFADTIYLLANWSITDSDKIYLGIDIQNDETEIKPTVPFGSLDMYPWPLRDFDTLDNVKINPAWKCYSKSVGYTYCYAMEIAMKKISTTSFSGWKGNGAFTMAYNPNVKNKAEYEPNPSRYVYPLLDIKNNSTKKHRVFLKGYLLPLSLTDMQLDIKIAYIDNPDIEFTIFSYIFKDIVREDMESDFGAGGIAGLITPTTEFSDFSKSVAVRDVQIIFPDQFENRKDYIDRYAFNYDSMDEFILRDDNITLPVSAVDLPITSSKNIRALRQGEDGNRTTISTEQPVEYKQLDNIESILYANISDSIIIYPHYDNTGRIVLEVRGAPFLEFGKDADSYSILDEATGQITWQYINLTVESEDVSFVKAYNFTGTMVVDSSVDFPDAMIDAYAENLKTRLTLPESLDRRVVAIDLNPYKLSYLSSSDQAWKFWAPFDESLQSSINKYIELTKVQMRNVVNDFLLHYAYILVGQKGSINDVTTSDNGTSEGMYIRGMMPNFGSFTTLNKAWYYKLPSVLLSKDTPSNEKIKPWDFKDPKISNTYKTGIVLTEPT